MIVFLLAILLIVIILWFVSIGALAPLGSVGEYAQGLGDVLYSFIHADHVLPSLGIAVAVVIALCIFVGWQDSKGY